MIMSEEDFKKFSESIYKMLAEIKPITEEQIKEMERKANESPELKKLNKEIAELKAINAVFEKNKKYI